MTIRAYLKAYINVEDGDKIETKIFDLGIPYHDVAALTDEELIENGRAVGIAYGQLLIKTKENQT